MSVRKTLSSRLVQIGLLGGILLTITYVSHIANMTCQVYVRLVFAGDPSARESIEASTSQPALVLCNCLARQIQSIDTFEAEGIVFFFRGLPTSMRNGSLHWIVAETSGDE